MNTLGLGGEDMDSNPWFLVLLLSLLALGAGCPGSEGRGDDDDDTGSDTDDDVAGDDDTGPDEVCDQGGWSPSAAAWSLPTAHGGIFWLTYDWEMADENWALFDIDGDDAPDIVVARDDEVSDDLGDTEWWVYRNTGSGFASSATPWSLPTAHGGIFWNTYDWSLADENWTLTDLTGDGLIDIVVARDSEASEDLGDTEWWVYHNTGSGFATSATPWSLPTAHGNIFWATYDWELADENWTLTDLDGDGLIDIVVARDDEVSEDLGDTEWWVYLGVCE